MIFTKIVHDIFASSLSFFFILNLRYSISSDLIASVESPFAPLLNGVEVKHLKFNATFYAPNARLSQFASDLKQLFLQCNSNVKFIIVLNLL